MITPEDLELIDLFILGELSPADQLTFKKKLESNPELKKELENQQELLEIINTHEEQEFNTHETQFNFNITLNLNVFAVVDSEVETQIIRGYINKVTKVDRTFHIQLDKPTIGKVNIYTEDFVFIGTSSDSDLLNIESPIRLNSMQECIKHATT